MLVLKYQMLQETNQYVGTLSTYVKIPRIMGLCLNHSWNRDIHSLTPGAHKKVIHT